MDKKKIMKKIEQLSIRLEQHNRQYYSLDEPLVSDNEYDDLMKQLSDLESKYPEFKKDNSPTQRVGDKVTSSANTVEHKVKMYSLDNTYSFEELELWHKRVLKGIGEKNGYVVELKIDGVSASLSYEKGQFVLGATRGDGKTGEDVTQSLKTIRSIPLILNEKAGVPKTLDVRAEVFMNLNAFDKLNQQRKREDKQEFANPRNATSGSIKLLDSRITAQRKLNCIVHSFGVWEGSQDVETQWDFLLQAKKLGFFINPLSQLCKSFKEVVAFCQKYQNQREIIPYEVDGVVNKVFSARPRSTDK